MTSLVREFPCRSIGVLADSYHISSKTIEPYRARLLKKLNLRNNAELTRFAIQNRVVEL